MKKNSFRRERLTEKIVADMNVFFRRELNDPRLQFISITKAELNDDLSHCKIYWDSFNTDQREVMTKALEAMTGRVRTHLAKTLDIRHAPTVQLLFDAQYEAEHEIGQLLKNERNRLEQDSE